MVREVKGIEKMSVLGAGRGDDDDEGRGRESLVSCQCTKRTDVPQSTDFKKDCLSLRNWRMREISVPFEHETFHSND